jgi:hypothetical protein
MTEQQIRNDERKEIVSAMRKVLRTYPVRTDDRYLTGRMHGIESMINLVNLK